MAEYWKSTPKYWCKFCSTYVKDTKFEKQQHEATGRHQGNIQRSLKGLHREQQTQVREAQRAKDEVRRLKGEVGGAENGAGASASANVAPRDKIAGADGRVGAKPTFTRGGERMGTLEDRKRQMQQLVAMGVAVPEEMRGDMAMAGEWTVVSSKVVSGADGEEGEEKVASTGVHKRKVDEVEAERIANEELVTKQRGWGGKVRRFPGKMGDDDDVESLFMKGKAKTEKVKPEVKEETNVLKEEDEQGDLKDIPTEEEAATSAAATAKKSPDMHDVPVKTEDEDAPAPAVVFKKRKKIRI